MLLLTPQRPYPPHQGTTLRNFNLIKELAKRYTVYVLTFLEPDQNPTDSGPLTAWCDWVEMLPVPQRSTALRLRQMMTTTRPDMSWRLWSPHFAERLQSILSEQSFDVVEIEGIEMAPYLSVVEQATPKPLIIYDAHNAEWILQYRAWLADRKNPRRWLAALYSAVQWRRLWRYEADLLNHVDHIIAMSEPDENALRQVSAQTPITIVPNGVDLVSYGQYDGQPLPYDLLFTGKMDFRPNIDAVLWFAEQVLPLIQSQRPETTLAIVGQRPHPRLDRLRSIPGVTITGFVDDVRPYLAGATVYVAPLRVGGGTRLKLMEAMATGCPIVSTTVGAEGFPARHNQELLLADQPADFAEAVLALLNQPQRRAELGQMGRIFAYSHYGWDRLVPQLEQVYHRS
ncbi:glycosyltransferase [Anaerolineales bacterium HSG25]|nr:glycosyltransferase [Anaerolineales bacterium HSG25]